MPRKTACTPAGSDGSSACFNEAAARCHGKLDEDADGVLLVVASMRPRPDATENDQSCSRHSFRPLLQ